LGTPKDYRDYAQLQSEITQSDAADVRFFVDSTVNADVWNQRRHFISCPSGIHV
jgi:hypothetical protein